MTDVHAHLLPGVDDGIKTTAEAWQTLARMEALGVERILLTPHVSDEHRGNTPLHLREVFAELETANPTAIRLQLAGEYMLDNGYRQRLEAGLLTLSESQVLVETSYLRPPMELDQLLYETCMAGYVPVLAHPERYMYMQATDYDRLQTLGCRFQLNLFALGGWYGSEPARKARKLLQQGRYTFVGSDCHSRAGYEAALERLKLSRKECEALQLLKANNRSL